MTNTAHTQPVSDDSDITVFDQALQELAKNYTDSCTRYQYATEFSVSCGAFTAFVVVSYVMTTHSGTSWRPEVKAVIVSCSFKSLSDVNDLRSLLLRVNDLFSRIATRCDGRTLTGTLEYVAPH